MSRAVLCAIDRDTSSTVPMEAGELAAGLGCPLVLVHVARDNGFTEARPGWEHVRAVEEERALGLLHRARLELRASANVTERVAFGSPVGMLIALAREENAELLVVGSRGLGPLEADTLGDDGARAHSPYHLGLRCGVVQRPQANLDVLALPFDGEHHLAFGSRQHAANRGARPCSRPRLRSNPRSPRRTDPRSRARRRSALLRRLRSRLPRCRAAPRWSARARRG